MSTAWMYNLAKAVKAALAADTGVTGYVSTRIYPSRSVQNPTYPYITYTAPLYDGPEHILGTNDPILNRVQLQIDWWTQTYTDVVNLGDAIFLALDGTEITVAGWGTARLEADYSTILDEDINGVIYWRGIRRYRALLCA